MITELGILAITLFVLLGIIVLGLIIWAIIFWILMLIDCAKRKFKGDIDKVVWILIIIFVGIIGAIIYYFVIKKK